MENLLQELDERYVKKDDLKKKVTDIVDDKFMTKEDCNIILGKMNAMEIELAKNTKLLMGISESSEETKHLQIVQKTEMKGLDEEIKSLKKKQYRRIWDAIPSFFKFFIITIVILTILFTYSIIIGEKATEFMNKNGLEVAMGSLLTSIATMYLTKKKNSKEE
ncbi:hypothetical protein [Enterococcus sp. AZ177]|uniref:hypothetical protein n=1 Tax=unclassified Enterococcus TaxID=2608891 RepID=UPI003D2FC590